MNSIRKVTLILIYWHMPKTSSEHYTLGGNHSEFVTLNLFLININMDVLPDFVGGVNFWHVSHVVTSRHLDSSRTR